MKKFFDANRSVSIRADYFKGLNGIEDVFDTGLDSVLISCRSSESFQLCNPNAPEQDISGNLNTGLDEIFSSFKNKRFIIEIYGNGEFSDKLSDIISRHSMQHDIAVWAGNSALMKKIRKKLPETATAMTPSEFLYLYFLFKTGFLYFKKQFKADFLLSIEAAGISYILNKAMLGDMEKRGIFSIALADSKEHQIKRLIDSGCRGYVFKNIEHYKLSEKLLQDAGII